MNQKRGQNGPESVWVYFQACAESCFFDANVTSRCVVTPFLPQSSPSAFTKYGGMPKNLQCNAVLYATLCICRRCDFQTKVDHRENPACSMWKPRVFAPNELAAPQGISLSPSVRKQFSSSMHRWALPPDCGFVNQIAALSAVFASSS